MKERNRKTILEVDEVADLSPSDIKTLRDLYMQFNQEGDPKAKALIRTMARAPIFILIMHGRKRLVKEERSRKRKIQTEERWRQEVREECE